MHVVDEMGSLEHRLNGEIVTFLTSDGIKLNGLFVQNKPTKKCVIYVHGMDSNFYSSLPISLAKYFNDAGFAMLSINTRGHDSVASLSRMSGNKRQRVLGGTSYERFEDSYIDIKAAIDEMVKLGFKKFVLCGYSTGCQKAAYYLYKTKDKRVDGLILLAPADDYNLYRSNLGGDLGRIARLVESLMNSGNKDELIKDKDISLSAQRLDSLINLDNVEARLFNYEGDLEEFSTIKVPIYATFGSKEEYSVRDVKKCLQLLEDRNSAASYTSEIINGADHSFHGKTDVLGKSIVKWLKQLTKNTKR